MANVYDDIPENLCEWCCCRRASHLVPREFLDVRESWERCQKQFSSRLRSDNHPQIRCQCMDHPDDWSDHGCDSCEEDCVNFCNNRFISWDDEDEDDFNQCSEFCIQPKFCKSCEDEFRNVRNLALNSFTTITPRRGGFNINTGIKWPVDNPQFCTCISDGDNAKLCCNCMKSCVDLEEKPRKCTCRQYEEPKWACTCKKPEPKQEIEPPEQKPPRRNSKPTESIVLPGIPEIESISDTNLIKNSGILKNPSPTHTTETLQRDSNLFSVDSNNSILPDLNAKIYRKSMEDSLPIIRQESAPKTIASVIKVDSSTKKSNSQQNIEEKEPVSYVEEDIIEPEETVESIASVKKPKKTKKVKKSSDVKVAKTIAKEDDRIVSDEEDYSDHEICKCRPCRETCFCRGASTPCNELEQLFESDDLEKASLKPEEVDSISLLPNLEKPKKKPSGYYSLEKLVKTGELKPTPSGNYRLEKVITTEELKTLSLDNSVLEKLFKSGELRAASSGNYHLEKILKPKDLKKIVTQDNDDDKSEKSEKSDGLKKQSSESYGLQKMFTSGEQLQSADQLDQVYQNGDIRRLSSDSYNLQSLYRSDNSIQLINK